MILSSIAAGSLTPCQGWDVHSEPGRAELTRIGDSWFFLHAVLIPGQVGSHRSLQPRSTDAVLTGLEEVWQLMGNPLRKGCTVPGLLCCHVCQLTREPGLKPGVLPIIKANTDVTFTVNRSESHQKLPYGVDFIFFPIKIKYHTITIHYLTCRLMKITMDTQCT